jgi:hypothetical protein
VAEAGESNGTIRRGWSFCACDSSGLRFCFLFALSFFAGDGDGDVALIFRRGCGKGLADPETEGETPVTAEGGSSFTCVPRSCINLRTDCNFPPTRGATIDGTGLGLPLGEALADGEEAAVVSVEEGVGAATADMPANRAKIDKRKMFFIEIVRPQFALIIRN